MATFIPVFRKGTNFILASLSVCMLTSFNSAMFTFHGQKLEQTRRHLTLGIRALYTVRILLYVSHNSNRRMMISPRLRSFGEEDCKRVGNYVL